MYYKFVFLYFTFVFVHKYNNFVHLLCKFNILSCIRLFRVYFVASFSSFNFQAKLTKITYDNIMLHMFIIYCYNSFRLENCFQNSEGKKSKTNAHSKFTCNVYIIFIQTRFNYSLCDMQHYDYRAGSDSGIQLFIETFSTLNNIYDFCFLSYHLHLGSYHATAVVHYNHRIVPTRPTKLVLSPIV